MRPLKNQGIEHFCPLTEQNSSSQSLSTLLFYALDSSLLALSLLLSSYRCTFLWVRPWPITLACYVPGQACQDRPRKESLESLLNLSLPIAFR